ncbi:unnamed protein product [Cladocopium goreaui]|uniref:EF-hand domain-containing protein n=1 Tax=Cladocopium goreaui TaxID=2562237 RepID=A0A9P1FH05_9DINO|nr:unnamed protein product [Cladocopium goreaui]
MPLLVRELQMEIGGCRITLWQQEGQQIWWTIKDVLRLLWNAESDARWMSAHPKAALFDQLDTNGDDEVNLQEFQAAQVRDLVVATGQRKVDLFDELDSNLDGRVTREEFAAVTAGAAQWMGEDALIGAVLAEDSERALTLLRTADVTVRDKEGCTALHRASALPGLARVRRALLLGGSLAQRGLDGLVDCPKEDKNLKHGNESLTIRLVDVLIARKPKVGEGRRTPSFDEAASFHDADRPLGRRSVVATEALHLAAEYGRAEVCRCLLDHPKFTVVDVLPSWMNGAMLRARRAVGSRKVLLISVLLSMAVSIRDIEEHLAEAHVHGASSVQSEEGNPHLACCGCPKKKGKIMGYKDRCDPNQGDPVRQTEKCGADCGAPQEGWKCWTQSKRQVYCTEP